ncbi:DUF6520 family protein [Flavivirga rizhaonensis]|uniref:Uncharacterized protein n=1 Tax=Flavivirga rizhaonensis TaxID=2559571 RepID=A0A4S1E114_9FLAO|nr:DUF6520 family protein [Flavivirga rizhaonensis]TGV03608.1 hypothetical protein EM932_06165 [Flavivirga rizhaonensis]
MKSKKKKVIVHVFAIMLAISLCSFTTNRDVTKTAYYDDPYIPEIQSTTIDCELCSVTGTGDLCTIQVGPFQFQLYCTPDLDTIPNNELRRIDPC